MHLPAAHRACRSRDARQATGNWLASPVLTHRRACVLTCGAPRRSRDGTRIAFDAYDENGNLDIYAVPSAGGPMRRVTSEKSEEGRTAWPADGNFGSENGKSGRSPRPEARLFRSRAAAASNPSNRPTDAPCMISKSRTRPPGCGACPPPEERRKWFRMDCMRAAGRSRKRASTLPIPTAGSAAAGKAGYSTRRPCGNGLRVSRTAHHAPGE